MRRREFLTAGSMLVASGWSGQDSLAANAGVVVSQEDRLRGALIGGLIGDALGGPIEFRESPAAETGLTAARSWGDGERLTKGKLQELAQSVPLLGYADLRPDPAAYGPWKRKAPAGTLTDDSRHKIVLIRALAAAKELGREATAEDIAKQFLAFEPVNKDRDQELRDLNEEGFREYRYAAEWLLGVRDLSKARPLERLWAGVNNCSGQMMFPPLAVQYAGEPEPAYRRTYELDFIDSPLARDIASALVAGLAAALAPDRSDNKSDISSEERWQTLLEAMRSTDPYGYGEVPFAGRQLDKWLSRAEEFADKADGRPKELYHLLETDGKPVYWWDAHFTLLVPLSMLYLCDFEPLAAMHLTLDFGHDTDSYAQVLGCMIGAVHGALVFPEKFITATESSLRTDFGENVEGWLTILRH